MLRLTLALSTLMLTATAHAHLLWPVSGTITSLVGDCRPLGSCTRRHAGIDIAENDTDAVGASIYGKTRTVSRDGSGYGNLVIVGHHSGFTTYYAHLSSFMTSVGESLPHLGWVGRRGNTGTSSGPHLHFELRKDGAPLSIAARRGAYVRRGHEIAKLTAYADLY